MTLLEYRIFHTVTQQGSFARAAQILHLTPAQSAMPSARWRKPADLRSLSAERAAYR